MKSVIENNKLIATFMDNYQQLSNDVEFGRFHLSWDALMPVVEKIESLDLKEYGYQWEDEDGTINYNCEGISVEIENNRCWIYKHLALDPMQTLNEKTFKIKYNSKIEAVYNSVIEFIEYYNELITDNEINQ